MLKALLWSSSFFKAVEESGARRVLTKQHRRAFKGSFSIVVLKICWKRMFGKKVLNASLTHQTHPISKLSW